MNHDRQIVFALGAVGLGALAWIYSQRASAAASGLQASAGGAPDSSGGGAAGDPSVSTGVGDFSIPSFDTVLSMIGIPPKGIRNHNPGNIRTLPPDRAWDGQVGDDNGYGVYVDDAHGVRALGHQLVKYANNGWLTVRSIVTHWAPRSENDTMAYIAAVGRSLGVGPDDTLDVVGNLPAIAAAIIWHENGQQPYDPNDIATWVYAP